MARRVSSALLLLALVAASGMLALAQDSGKTSSDDSKKAGSYPRTLGYGGANATNATKSKGDEDEDKGSVDLAVGFLKAANISVENSTIFAPTDKAFAKLAKSLNVSNATAFTSPALLNTSLSVLSLHVVPGVVLKSSDLKNNTSVATLVPGKNLTVLLIPDKKGEVEVEIKSPGSNKTAEVKKADIPFGSNIVHVIDRVLT